jgi:hypothetical protein
MQQKSQRTGDTKNNLNRSFGTSRDAFEADAGLREMSDRSQDQNNAWGQSEIEYDGGILK